MEAAGHTDSQDVQNASRPPLVDASKQIRLLKVEPGGFDDEIKCTISSCALSEGLEFNAISYTWGLEQPQSDIFIDGLRFPDNLHEKSVQVGIMGDVYARAATVLACIGKSDVVSDYIEAVIDDIEKNFVMQCS
ncbi:uncharacterized protein B0I36DRAFT_370153 [Microdochium trichocladiopsis]|uniref:Heterokaryon incompatibility domain-containing protein n=1 Tax=Microdochium trichocladiopsis TaxID=1682393 RepID=A0A9P8XQI5_9PEZI|nr:uncharacterized protein B0I36DRAFT_370153 [Microdochium trichocladiopsis]KAH7010873.1 hypothetical protein B0I36DRAFT_370153 [Microdochium trichocladiopsis]